MDRYPRTSSYLTGLFLGLVIGIVGTATVEAQAAVQLRTPTGAVAQPYQAWADRSHVPTPNVTLTLAPRVAACGTAPACTVPGIVYGDQLTRGDLMHEIGHQFDWAVMNGADRWRYRKMYPGYDGLPWTGDIRLDLGFNPLVESFAADYMNCAWRGTRWSVLTNREWKIRANRGARIACRIIKTAAAHQA